MRDLANSAAVAFAIGVLLAIGAALIAVDSWRLAEGVFIFAGAWPVLWLWFQPLRNQIFEWSVLVTTAAVVFGLIYFTEQFRVYRILEKNHGWLLPANEWVPPVCGNNLGLEYKTLWIPGMPVAAAGFPITIIKIFNEDLLSIGIVENALAVSAKIFSPDGRSIAIIKDNEFTVNMNNVMKKENPDFSTLVVFDQYAREVINVRYMNPKVIRIRALLRYKGVAVAVNDDGVFIDGQPKIGNVCIITPVPVTIIEVG